MKLSDRQQIIIQIVKDNEPISADAIADKLGLSKSTIRSDLAVLSVVEILEAKPKVGYVYLGSPTNPIQISNLYQVPAQQVMSKPLLVHQETEIQEAIEDLFMFDSGSLFVINKEKELIGLASRKDLLRFLLSGSSNLATPIGIIMTRMPNIIVAYEDTTLFEVAQLLQHHEIDSLPIVSKAQPLKVIGKISKTTILNQYINSNQED